MDSPPKWPDPLQPPSRQSIDELLSRFWHHLRELADRLERREFLLANEITGALRSTVLEMMLALNGIQRPPDTRHLNGYLGESQQAAIEKTMRLLGTDQVSGWIGQASSLVVIYRWYAPQLVAKYALHYPQTLEDEVWQLLCSKLPGWPEALHTGDLHADGLQAGEELSTENGIRSDDGSLPS